MQLRQIQQFLAIAQWGSLQLASRRLGLSQPALTKSMHNLEQELGAPLLLRTARGTTMTHFGDAFLPRARIIAAELQEAHDELSRLSGEDQDSLIIAAAPIAAVSVLPKALQAFRKRRKNTRVQILNGHLHTATSIVRSGSVDLYVGPLHPEEVGRDLKMEELFRNEVLVMARPGSPWSRASRLQDLAEAEWVGEVADARQDTIVNMFVAHGLPPPPRLTQCQNFIQLVSLVAGSDLLTALPSRLMADPMFREILKPIHIVEKLEIPSVGILTRSGSPATSAQTAFISAIKQVCR